MIVSGVPFAVYEAGTGAPVFFIHGAIHGAAGGARAWERIMPFIARRFRAIIYDHLGFGHTKGPLPAPHEARAVHAHDAAALLQGLGAVPSWIVGHSSGGSIALHLALLYPQLVRGLVLLEAPLYGSNMPSPRLVAGFSTALALAMLCREHAAAAAFMRAVSIDRSGKNSYDCLDHEAQALLVADASAIVREMKADPGRELTEHRSQRGILCPLAYVYGTRSVLQVHAIVDRLCRLVPFAYRVPLANVGHFMLLEQPEAVAHAIEEAMMTSVGPSALAQVHTSL